MGEIKVKIGLENFVDRYMYLEKKIEENEIRKYEMEAIVETGAMMLVLPQDIIEELGLIPDCQRQTLTPRPESPIYPSLKLK